MENDMELILGFTQEARDYLDEVEPALIELSQESGETGETDYELINGVFRLFHSMKGSAGFLNLNTVASLTHEAETLLEKIRKGKATLTHDITTMLCQTLDLFREMLDSIEESGSDGGFDDRAKQMCGLLKRACAGEDLTLAPETLKVVETQPKAKKSSLKADLIQEVPADDELPAIEITDEMRKGFFMEASEQLEAAELSLLNIENEEVGAPESLNEAFRNIHSFKGNCGFMGFVHLERLSHSMENALDMMRSGDVEADSSNLGVMLSLIDVLKDIVSGIHSGADGRIDSLEVYLQFILDMLPEDEDLAETSEPVEEGVAKEDSTSAVTSAVQAEQTPAVVATAPATAETVQPVAAEAQPAAQNNEVESEAERAAQKSTERARRAVRQDIRVDLQKLDNLINLVGELVIAEAMVTRCPAVSEIDDEYYSRAKHQLRRICDELQDIAMSVRMIPLSGVFRKMIRLVHDLSHKAGKKLRLDIVGEDTEVDKTVIEQIGDPLVHIVRNSCDHGIEKPEDRIKAGKPETGTVTIEGRHEGGEVWILIRDDGHGLSREKILSRAIERGLVQGDGRDLPDERVFRMIFEPGFSTADKITDISGRGVGMDVVKRNIEKLNGRVDVRSKEGQGSTIILRIPLTLAIIDGMLVRVGQAKYTIPVLTIRESLRPESSAITRTPDGAEILRLRDEMIPVVRLHQIFGQECDSTRLDEGILVIAEDAGVSVALFVDEIVGQQQTVIKGLSEYIGKARGCSGCTILGDGAVSLILDITTVVSMAEEQMMQGVGMEELYSSSKSSPAEVEAKTVEDVQEA